MNAYLPKHAFVVVGSLKDHSGISFTKIQKKKRVCMICMLEDVT